MARCLEKELSQFNSHECWLKVSNQIACKKRDYFIELLKDTGFKPIVPDGGFFIVADWSDLGQKSIFFLFSFILIIFPGAMFTTII